MFERGTLTEWGFVEELRGITIARKGLVIVTALMKRFVPLFFVTILVMLMLSVAAASAVGPTFPSDAFDPTDDNPFGATDITSSLGNTGAGKAPFESSRVLDEAQMANFGHDPDWYRFDVSAQEVIWEYSYLFEAISFTDAHVDPVIEIYGPYAAPGAVTYQYAHNFPQWTYDPSSIVGAGNMYGEWFSNPWVGQSTHRGASLVFRPTASGTYWIRVRPYGDNTGSNYYDQAGPYTFRAKIATTTRVSGANRIATAVQISKEGFVDDQLDGSNMWTNLSAAIVVNGYVFPDALSASSLAGIIQGPILLAEQNELPALTAAEIQRLDPDTVYVVGGPAAVSDGVVADIEALFPAANPVKVERVWGSNRVATSVAVADKALGLSSQTPVIPAGFAFIANAYNFPDALSASSMAAGDLVPILLTDAAALDVRVENAITARGIKDVIIVGGPVAISPAVETKLKALLGNGHVLRLAGADRYETSKEFAVWAAGTGGNVGTPGNSNALKPTDPRRIGLATGENFPDALAAGPFCGDDWYGNPKPLLLTKGDRLSKWVVDVYGGSLASGQTSYFEDIWNMGGPTKVDRSYIFGGPAALSEQVWWGIDSQS